ncbi:hypothetical protein J6590_066779 [Homalodisca vitripennis]|nr:hypothetical protein J6590_066779 [Homalodisca vitripennis]
MRRLTVPYHFIVPALDNDIPAHMRRRRLEVTRRILFGTSQTVDEFYDSIGKKLLYLVEGTGIDRPYER